MTTVQADPGFRERFERRRELFIGAFTGAVSGLPGVTCRPVDRSFAFGWMFEEGHTSHPLRDQGGTQFGVSYLRHMIDQGLRVGFAVSLVDGGTVYLKAWESADEKPRWPRDSSIVLVCTWRPQTGGGKQ